MSGEEYKIVLKIQGEEKLKQLQETLDKDTAYVAKVNDALQKGTISQAQFAAGTARAVGRIKELNTEIKAVEDSLKRVGPSGVRAAQGFLEVSRAVEDAQYGLRGVINNIPTAVMMFGGGAGLAGAISLASVGVNILVNNWGTLSDHLNAAWSGSSVEQLKTLREKAEETAEAFKKLAEMPSKAAAAQSQIITEAIAEVGGNKLAHQLGQAIGASPLRAEPEGDEGRIRSSLQASLGGPTTALNADTKRRAQEKLKALDEKLIQANRKKAEELITEVAKGGEAGEKARLTIKGLNPASLPKDFLQALDESTPKAQAKKKAEQEEAKSNQDHADEMRKAGRKRQDEAVDALMKSTLPKAILAPGAEGKSFLPQVRDALAGAGMKDVDAVGALRDLSERLKKQSEAKGLETGKDGRAALLEDLNRPEKEKAAREKDKADREKERLEGIRLQGEKTFRREKEQRLDQVTDPMMKSPLEQAMLMPGAERMNFEPMMQQALKQAGVKDVGAGEALDALRKKTEEMITSKSLEKDVDRDTAKAMLLEDTFSKKEMKGGRAEFTGVADFAKKMQTDILNGANDVPKQQLGTLNQIRDLIKQQKQQGAPAAIAVGPR